MEKSPILPSGVLLADKPTDWSSFDVVNKVRGALSAYYRQQTGVRRRFKVGHSGTLDPFASGLLILAVGSATKSIDEFTKQDKTYRGVIILEATSTTGDRTGDVQSLVNAPRPTKTQILRAMEGFLGSIKQIPPVYSAIKINGQRAYEKARKGQIFTMKARSINVKKLKLTSYDYPKLSFECEVSSGTYIRTLAEDIAKALGSRGYLGELRRLKIGDFSVNDALKIDSDIKAEAILKQLM